LFEIVERRREALHNYLEWAKANDNEQWTFRMSARPDIRRAAGATARLHLEERNGTLRVAAQLVFTGRDASLYLVPYSIRGEYFYGEQTFAAGQRDMEIKLREQVASERRPKLAAALSKGSGKQRWRTAANRVRRPGRLPKLRVADSSPVPRSTESPGRRDGPPPSSRGQA
jgi:hypothetical protein